LETYKLTEINDCEISIGPCPKGGDHLERSMGELRDCGTTMIISLLTYPESLQLGLSSEADVSKTHSIEFINFPIMDKGICGFDQFVEFIEFVYRKTNEFESILIHCQHGVGRSGMVALGLMIRDGKELEESIMSVSKTRGYDVPQSLAQRKLLSAFNLYILNKFH